MNFNQNYPNHQRTVNDVLDSLIPDTDNHIPAMVEIRTLPNAGRQARDIEEESKYWREEAIRKKEFDKDWKEYVKRMKIILYGNGNSLKSKGIINANCKIDKEIK